MYSPGSGSERDGGIFSVALGAGLQKKVAATRDKPIEPGSLTATLCLAAGNAPRVILSSDGGGPDRFAHFTSNGDLVYSHVVLATNRASLWQYSPFTNQAEPYQLLDWTESDDDAFADRQFGDYIAFSGWGGDGYDLYLTRQSAPEPAVQVTDGINVLGTVTFGYAETR